MEIFFGFVKAFLVGGVLCAIGEVLLLRTKMTSARILVLYVVAGVVLTGIGIYKPLVDFGGAGATTPLTGFGYSLATGAMQGVNELGLLGALVGGLRNTAAGIAAAVVFGLGNALLFMPKTKK